MPLNVYIPIWADAKCLSDKTKPELNKHLRHSYCSPFFLSTRLKCNSDVSAESLSHMVQILCRCLSLSLSALLSLFSHSLLFLLFSLLLLYQTRHCRGRKKKMTLSQLSFMSSLECLSFWQQRGDSSLYSRAVCRAAYSKVTLIELWHHLPAFLCLFLPAAQYTVPIFLVKLSCYFLKSILYVNISYCMPWKQLHPTSFSYDLSLYMDISSIQFSATSFLFRIKSTS